MRHEPCRADLVGQKPLRDEIDRAVRSPIHIESQDDLVHSRTTSGRPKEVSGVRFRSAANSAPPIVLPSGNPISPSLTHRLSAQRTSHPSVRTPEFVTMEPGAPPQFVCPVRHTLQIFTSSWPT